MSERLDPSGSPVRVGGITLRTPGLEGVVSVMPPTSAETRAAAFDSAALEEALREEGVATDETLEITDTNEVEAGGGEGTRTAQGEPAIELEVWEPGEEWGQIVLYTDEAGVTTWAFSLPGEAAAPGERVRGGAGGRTYVLRRHVPPAPQGEATRGVIGAAGKKIIRVLSFKLLDPVFGRVGEHFVAKWEQEKRPYRVRTFPPEGFRNASAKLVDLPDWPALATSDGKRALLFVHGTFSRAHAAFGGLPPEFMEALHRRYEGRVFAFDHPTASEDPRQNVEWLLQEIPDRTRLDLDIICHSRGGLVSRVLAEKQADLALGSRQVRVHNVVFVAAPNAGTILVNEEHMGDFVDSYTNLLNFFPDNGVTEGLEWIITVAKHLACSTLKGLEGLQSMRPGGGFLTGINGATSPDKRYYAVASDFEPADLGLSSFKDGVMDRIFGHPNDLVVPTAGVWDHNGGSLFPIAEKLVLPDKGIHHSGYFSCPEVQRQIARWLEVETG
ncbi:MAG TPA: hypothetical protein VEL74_22570 [Thermoanaerobaculia bacterium]|nr:hypothetical protein [Thermoanaerobaculia bacterium]